MSQKAERIRPARSEKRTSHAVKRSPEILHCWKQVNQRLASLGEAERKIRALTDQFRQKVAVLKEQWLEASDPVERDREKFASQIERFYWAHRDEMQACGHKSVDLVFGRLGSRRFCSVVVLDAAAATEWLRKNGFNRYLRTHIEIDREALRSDLVRDNDDATDVNALLRCPDLRLQVDEEFWYQVDDFAADPPVLPGVRIRPRHAASAARSNPEPIRSVAARGESEVGVSSAMLDHACS